MPNGSPVADPMPQWPHPGPVRHRSEKDSLASPPLLTSEQVGGVVADAFMREIASSTSGFRAGMTGADGRAS